MIGPTSSPSRNESDNLGYLRKRTVLISLTEKGFARYAKAPPSIAFSAFAPLPFAVMMAQARSGHSSRISCAKSTPSPSGRHRSRKTNENSSPALNRSRASLNVPDSTTLILYFCKYLLIDNRISASSSTTSTGKSSG